MKLNRVLIGALAPLSGALLFLPGQVDAQEQGAAAGMLEEIVVTARRREESLQDLPLSIAAITADAMQAQGIYNIQQVGEFVPNLTFAESDRANNTRIFIRGIGGGHPDPTFPYGTGLYIDGHYIPNSTGAYFSTLDIERVEVLRGPQGTLFGKNTTGGAVNIITTKPQPEFGASALVRAGDFGQLDARGMLNLPLSDTASLRVSAASTESDGTYWNRFLNEPVDFKDQTAMTAALRLTPGDHWTLDATVMNSTQRDGNLGRACFPGSGNWSRGRDTHFYVGGDPIGTGPPVATPGLIEATAECALSNTMGPRVNASGTHTFSNVDQDGVFFGARWDSGGEVGVLDNLAIKQIASTREIRYHYYQERDYTPFDMRGIGTFGDDAFWSETTSYEFLAELGVNERLDIVTGVNYFDEVSSSGGRGCYDTFKSNFDPANPDVDIPCEPYNGLVFDQLPDREAITGIALGGGTKMATQNASVYNTSIGIFGHLNYALTDSWTLELGVRHTTEDRDFHNIEFALSNTSNNGGPYGTNNFDAIMNDRSVNQLGFYNEGSATFSETTPMISFSRAFEGGDTLDSGMLYFQYAEGFLTGGFNSEINTKSDPLLLSQFLTFQPEHVSNYEAGFKGSFADNRVQIASAVFFMDYTDKQDSITIDNSDGRFSGDPAFGVVTNVSEVEIYGIEFELRSNPWDGGFISADLGYLFNEYSVYNSLDSDTLQLIDLSEAVIEDYSPEWTLNWRVEHQFNLANGATVTPMFGAYWQSDYDWDADLITDAPSACFQPAYSKLRARLTYEPAAANYEVSVFGNNIGDETIFEGCSGNSGGLMQYRLAAPAAWGVEFNYRWGT